ncbi:colanic acid biosynthesis glycosyl transferase WcaI [Spirosoma oryzae]|uniref:Colanic acid biosynthesis glycosyl transferase WcaI n=1 Tax=Spirosoma oryzae TaxID=1469603 RepID=A0A2T0RGM4_9BACT|nr:WcaI family glycosyltransferase [Spirosoma oryzae]PRY20282.1 colanic acid biosynthesis glycosyl transferase WcaI [Spirosoma oryzae]
MKILLYSISYSPEVAGSGRFNGELTEWLAEHNHKVDVITAHPYYPEWRVHPQYRKKMWLKESRGRLTVYRTPLHVPSTVNGKTRIIHELSFVIGSLFHWARLCFTKYDVVIAVCPPFHVGFLPFLYSKIRGSSFIFHVQDLQVDAARSLGLIKSKKFLNILDLSEKFLLRKADKVSSISEGMKRNILSKGVSNENYFMLENWVDTNTFKPMTFNESLRSELSFLNTDKIALYSGNIGEKQGLEVLIDTAFKLRKYSNIKIVVSGEGVARERLQNSATQRGLNNLFFFPLRSFEELPRLLAMADIHLVIQKRATSDLVMPSKLTAILAMGGASIISADKGTSLSDTITEYKLGWVVEPEEATMLADAIISAFNSSELSTIRENARTYAENFLNKSAILSRYERMLQSMAK